MPGPRTLPALALAGALIIPWGAAAAGDTGAAAHAPIASEGCGASATTSDAGPWRTLSVAGENRMSLVEVPSGHDGQTPLPLIIWLHGQGMSATAMTEISGLPAFAEANDIVVAAPNGHQPDFGWMWEPGAAGVEPGLANRDVAFVDALIDDLGTELCLDLARVYASGHSIGGHGATTLACRLSDRIAAVVAAAGFTDLGAECDPIRTVPMLALAGTADEYILFEGGLGDFLDDRLPWGTTKGDEPFFNRADWSLAPLDRAESIALRQGCEPGAMAETVAPGLVRHAWSCPSGADVVLLVDDGGEHDWSFASPEVDANEIYWAFLRRFAVPA